MAGTTTQNEPRWSLLLFDSDGCTLATRTVKLHTSDDDHIEVGQVRYFRHGKDVYLVEVLALADTKQELNGFERDWRDTGRSDAIVSARSQEQVGNFLQVATEELVTAETQCEPDDINPGNLKDEIALLRQNQQRIIENQNRMMANQEKFAENHCLLMETVLAVKGMLETKFKKVADKPTRQIKTVIPPNASLPDLPRPAPVPERPVVTIPVPLEHQPAPAYLPTIPEIIDFDIPELLSTIATPRMSDSTEERSTPVHQPSPPVHQPSPPVHQSSPPVHQPSSQNQPKETEDTCARRLDFAMSVCYAPSVNIGSVRNPVFVDSVKLEKAKKLPTAQRFNLNLMEMVFSSEELATSSVVGGTMKYGGRQICKKALCRHKRNAIFQQAAFQYDQTLHQLQADTNIRNAMNAKCRSKKTSKD